MQFIIFILLYPLIWCLSILPMKVLYFISDIIYILLYYLIGYRKKVVRNNLKLAFPEKSNEELLDIEKKTFHHFIDIFMEMIKSFTISKNEISKRFIFQNIEILDEFYNKNKSLIAMAGHYANWEWAISASMKMSYKGYAAYSTINNKYLEEKIKKSRTKFGAIFAPTSKFIEIMQRNFDNKELGIYGLLSDQSPLLKKTHYWHNFLGVRVPIHTGAEMLAKKYDYSILYFKTERIKRGYYTSTIKVLAENPRDFEDYQITDLFLNELEKQIRNKPEFYFWTHKRFKHMGKEDEFLKKQR